MSDIDLAKKLNTSDVNDMSARFVNVDDFMDTSSSIPKSENTILFAEIADTIDAVPISNEDAFTLSLADGLEDSEKLLNTLTDTLGYIPTTEEDFLKAIDKTTSELSSQIFSPVVDMASSTLQTGNELLKSVLNPIQESEEKIVSFLDNKSSLLRSTFKDSYLDSINKTIDNYYNDSKQLIILAADDVKSFITDPLSSEYLSDIVDTDQLNDLVSGVTDILKYATNDCNLEDLVRTGIHKIEDLVDTLNNALNTAISGNMKNFLSDLITCLDRLSDTVNVTAEYKNIANKIQTLGKTELLDTLKDIGIDSINPDKLLYYSMKNSDSNQYDQALNYAEDNDINTEDFIKYASGNLYSYEDSVTDQLDVYDIAVIKSNPEFSNSCSQEDSESSSNPMFLSNVPSEILI